MRVNISVLLVLLVKRTIWLVLWWAGPGGTAMPGQPVTEVEQAPSTPSISKNQFNKLVPR